MLAQATALLLARGGNNFLPWLAERKGLYHLAGDGFASRLAWARKILELDPRREEQVCKELLPASTRDFPTRAVRPLFSALNCALFEEVFNLKMPPWHSALESAMEK
jgi:dTDP-4-dehydrorhamnose reductase